MLSPEERTLRARMAAQARWSRRDPHEDLKAAWAGQWRRYENQVDPERVLDPAERARRAESARKAHMTKMAFKSAVARRKAKQDGDAA